MRILRHVVCAVLMLPAVAVFGEDFDPTAMSFDELMFHAAQYGVSGGKLERKKAAKDELVRRGPESLTYLAENSHIRNIWFMVYAREFVDTMEKEKAVPALLDALDAPEERARKNTVYLLGFYEAPEYADRILPFLQEDEVQGAAVRTLGKWKVRDAIDDIIPVLSHEKERRRVLAANALRDIGDLRAAGALIDALHDPYFTVRKGAARALVALKAEAEVRAALESETDTRARRELERIVKALDGE